MSVLVQQLYASISRASVSPDRAEAWRVTTDGGRGEDLYALWNSVLEGMPATHDALNAEQVAPRTIQTQQRANAPAGQRPAQAAALAAAPAGANRADVTRVTAVADEPQVVMQSDVADAAGPAEAGGPTHPGATNNLAAGASTCEVQEPRAVLQARIADASIGAAYCVPAESARVFVHGAVVTVVVRNSTLSDQDAINIAFETARELTGQRSALVHLTLNGRTLYQQAEAADTRGATSGPNFVFAC